MSKGDNNPRFSFVGVNVNSLVVYEVPKQYLEKGVPLDELKAENPNTKWFLEGQHDAKVTIEYGKAPVGMKESASSNPLTEGVIYFVSSYVGTRDTGAFVGNYFRIRNGKAEEIHEEIGK